MCIQNDIAKTKQDMFNSIVKSLSKVGNSFEFTPHITLVDSSDDFYVRKIEYKNNHLYLVCGNMVYDAMEWLTDIDNWYLLDEILYNEIDIIENTSGFITDTKIYAVAMYVANDGWCEHWYPEIVSKFYTDKDCAIAEMERIRDLPKDDRMCLVSCLDCGELEIVEYELAKNS